MGIYFMDGFEIEWSISYIIISRILLHSIEIIYKYVYQIKNKFLIFLVNNDHR